MAKRAITQEGLLAPLADLLLPRSLPVTVTEVAAASKTRAGELRAAGCAEEAAAVARKARDWIRLERERAKWLAKYADVKRRQAARAG